MSDPADRYYLFMWGKYEFYADPDYRNVTISRTRPILGEESFTIPVSALRDFLIALGRDHAKDVPPELAARRLANSCATTRSLPNATWD